MARWQAIKGYEGIYEISDNGEIKSVDRPIIQKNGVKTFCKGRDRKTDLLKGYPRVCLSKNGIRSTHFVHLLVWDAFSDIERQSGYEIDHIDFNPNNPRLDNLQLLTKTDNVKRSWIRRKKLA